MRPTKPVKKVEARAVTKKAVPARSGAAKKPAGNSPSGDELIAARKAVGLSQAAAAELIFSTRRTLQDCEAGVAAMHPGLWELFQAKLAGTLPGYSPRTEV
jgi:DNA-binding transcriptional regulator YiaG